VGVVRARVTRLPVSLGFSIHKVSGRGGSSAGSWRPSGRVIIARRTAFARTIASSSVASHVPPGGAVIGPPGARGGRGCSGPKRDHGVAGRDRSRRANRRTWRGRWSRARRCHDASAFRPRSGHSWLTVTRDKSSGSRAAGGQIASACETGDTRKVHSPAAVRRSAGRTRVFTSLHELYERRHTRVTQLHRAEQAPSAQAARRGRQTLKFSPSSLPAHAIGAPGRRYRQVGPGAYGTLNRASVAAMRHGNAVPDGLTTAIVMRALE
jgi:hypothetical protein